MRLPENISDLLVEREAYRICPLLSSSDFVRFCTDRGMYVSEKRLLKLERLGLFRPFLRIYMPDQIYKIEYIDEGKRYRELGPLANGEVWTGDTKTELANFGFESRIVRSWLEEGFAWDPRVTVSPHLKSIETEPQRHEAYYSCFQIAHLRFLLQALTMRVAMEWAVEDDGVTPSSRFVDDRAWAAKDVRHIIELERKDEVGFREIAGPLCQAISDRYYPKTQTDERRFTLTGGFIDFDRWDWYEYARNWNARAVIELFDLTAERLKHIYERLSSEQSSADPIEKWHWLVRFISMERRKQLKGDALMAMTLREMALMLRMLYRDAFVELLPEPNEVGSTIFHRIPDISPSEDPLRALELVANDFGVNPKPKLVLFVEGETEEMVIPIIIDRLIGAEPSVYGIEIVNVHGVSNATGRKKDYSSALWQLVDYLHHHQTIAVVLMDNEGFASRNLRTGLPRATSIHFRDRRATRTDYVKVWKLSFEFDNFSDEELARMLSAFGKNQFTRGEIALCREEARRPLRYGRTNTIETLYRRKTGVGLNKPAFGVTAVDWVFDSATRRSPKSRPIVPFLEKVLRLASRNHQPVTHAMWEYNQRTGYFGTLKPGAVAKRRDLFGGARRQRRTRASQNTA